MQVDASKVLRVVKKWKISNKPQYRPFRCALCQKKMRKAWHVWLKESGYKVEVHFCRKCIQRVRK